ncbi:MAG: hypothetical protein ABJE95_10595 [Byssovorax sp.]
MSGRSRRAPATLLLVLVLVLAAGCAGQKGCAELKVTTLASSPVHEYGAIALDDRFVYWLDQGTPDDDYAAGAVMRVLKTGGDAQRIAGDAGNLLALAVDDAFVYWTRADGTEVLRAPAAGGRALPLLSGLKSPGGVAVDGSFVYVAETAWQGRVVKAPKGGGELVAIATEQHHPTEVLVDAAAVYWIDAGSSSDGAVMKVAKAGGAPVVLAEGLRRPRGLALDAGNVYWLQSVLTDPGGDRDSVRRVAKAGGAPVTLIDNQSGASALGVDDRNIYWASMFSGEIFGLPRAGGREPVVISDKQNGPGALAVDEAGIFWTTDARGTRGVKGQRHEAAVRIAVK